MTFDTLAITHKAVNEPMNLLNKLIVASAVAYGGLQLTRKVVRDRRRFSWMGKRVVITGGSRGLGLVIARQLADHGARIAICARTADDLAVAANDLRLRGAEVVWQVCDVRDNSQVKSFFHEVESKFDGVDIVFNVAGIITVGPLDSMTLHDFQDSMHTNCWGALHTTLSALPFMRRQNWGRIVNIASLGGKRAVPHMLPYAASKFALVGLSNGLRTELKHENIFVTTACPGLMRTGSPRNASFKGRHREEYLWFSIGDSLPLISMNVVSAAKMIVEACQQGRGEVMIAHPLNLSMHLQSLFPELTREILALANQVLPAMGGIGQRAAMGYESESKWSPSMLTKLTQDAAIANNEI
ncbi:MAG: SDR family oxidoreductase [Aureliella sp.]